MARGDALKQFCELMVSSRVKRPRIPILRSALQLMVAMVPRSACERQVATRAAQVGLGKIRRSHRRADSAI